MRKSVFFIAGLALGVFVAKQIESNPETKKTLNDAASKVKSFANAVSAGYKEQESKVVPAKRPARTTKTTSPAKRAR